MIGRAVCVRSLPQRLADGLTGRHRPAATAAERPRTFRLDDIVRYDWVLLREEPNVEIVFGQISRPWKPVAASNGRPPVAPAAFAAFDQLGFAKIAFNIRVEPYGASSSILTKSSPLSGGCSTGGAGRGRRSK